MLDVINSDYITTARSKGLPARIVLWRHAFRNGLIPIITIIGLSIPRDRRGGGRDRDGVRLARPRPDDDRGGHPARLPADHGRHDRPGDRRAASRTCSPTSPTATPTHGSGTADMAQQDVVARRSRIAQTVARSRTSRRGGAPSGGSSATGWRSIGLVTIARHRRCWRSSAPRRPRSSRTCSSGSRTSRRASSRATCWAPTRSVATCWRGRSSAGAISILVALVSVAIATGHRDDDRRDRRLRRAAGSTGC